MSSGRISRICGLSVISLIIISLSLPSCSGQKEEARVRVKKLDQPVYGFYLGEGKDELFSRARHRVRWEKAPPPRSGHPGEFYYLSRPLENTRGTEGVRLAFLDDQLMEVIVYYRNTGVNQLRKLRRELENRYGLKAVCPDGTVETVYKTYRIKPPQMSVTLRRIIKKEKTELYVQYLYDQLHNRLKQLKSQPEKE